MRTLSIGRAQEVSPFDHLNTLISVSKKQQKREALDSLGKHFDKDGTERFGPGELGIERERAALLEEIADLQKKRADALEQDRDRIINQVNKQIDEFYEYLNQYVWYRRRR